MEEEKLVVEDKKRAEKEKRKERKTVTLYVEE